MKTKALIARGDAKSYGVAFETIDTADWPEGDVTIRVSHSGVNYKDGLAMTGRAPIIRSFPIVLGIDLAGEVVEAAGRFKTGDKVIVNGWGLSETRWGAYSELVRMPASIVQPLPVGLTGEQAAQIGTAGYTAMLCVMALTGHGLQPGRDAVLVTGASGGVGSVAVSLLARAGFHVIALSGRAEQEGFLRDLGAAEVLGRDAISAGGRPMAKERWAGVVDVVGGQVLADAIAQCRYDGIIAACGMAGGGGLQSTVYPFILRGVTLRGVDSVNVPMARRETAWETLARDLDPALLAALSVTRSFGDLPQIGLDLLEGRLKGRVAVAL
ncbi:acrylyl-CoA reductase family protein [Gemmobacter denitrificans]|uniref:Acryloyl-CoA reductase n=1 Tax=Gemmobacter denitrificans TaxID=3123040 RepID=A0ABU8BV15_9RHOB